MSLHENKTLESLCIDILICNFDRFCAAFLSGGNNLKFYLEFIQRNWSAEILKKLYQRCILQDDHLYVLINKYTTELDFQSILNCENKTVINRLKEIGNVIQKVYMKDMPIFYNFDSMWSYLSNVHTVELQQTNCSNQSLSILSENCPHLKNLNLFGCCKVNDLGLTYLIKNKVLLESLNAEGTSVTYKGIACILKEIPSLTKLWHANVPKAIFEVFGLNDSLETVSKDKVFNLNNIVINNNSFRPQNNLISVLKVCQSACPYINDLTVSQIVTGSQLSLCSTFTDLKTVNLQGTLFNNRVLSADDFLKISGDNIHTLSLVALSLTPEVLLSSCPNLECLTLDYPSFNNVPFIDPSPDLTFPNLKFINLYNFLISDDNIPAISCIISLSPNLEELNIRRSELSTEITDAILHYPKNLKVLNLSNTSVQASFLEEVLKTHKKLNVLRIDNSGITPDEYDDLMDIVDGMENKVHILWADYTEAIRQLYNTDLNALFHVMKRQVMKL